MIGQLLDDGVLQQVLLKKKPIGATTDCRRA
jgi:hypothetical protein